MIIFLTLLCVLLFAALCVALFYIWKFAKIIMIFEDDLSESINTLNEVEDTIKQVLEMQMFFDSPEVQRSVMNIMEQIKMSRLVLQKVIQRFTARSKQQYITVWDMDEELLEEEYENSIPSLPGQPPGTPNPMRILRQEGIIMDVGRNRRK